MCFLYLENEQLVQMFSEKKSLQTERIWSAYSMILQLGEISDNKFESDYNRPYFVLLFWICID